MTDDGSIKAAGFSEEGERATALSHFDALRTKLPHDDRWHKDRDFREAWRALQRFPDMLWPRPSLNGTGRAEGVVLLGKGPLALFAPWGRAGWEFWGLNEATYVPPIGAHTRWFQLHPPRYLKRHHPPGLDDLAENWTAPRGMIALSIVNSDAEINSFVNGMADFLALYAPLLRDLDPA